MKRLRSIDTVRGFVLALMLFTPPVGTHWPLLRHAHWNGLTISDLVFPTFLATSGASLAFLVKAPVTADTVRRLVRRTISLVVLGVLYNAFGTTGADLSHVRLTGVLQLIGLCGALTAAIVLLARWLCRGRDRVALLAAVAVGLTLVYGVMLEVRDERCGDRVDCSPLDGINEAFVGDAHAYRAGDVDYDPEGVPVVFAASGLVLAGYCGGLVLRERRPPTIRDLAKLAGVGAGLAIAGALLDAGIPINKRLFSSSFALVTSGVFLLLVALFGLALDTEIKGKATSAVDRLRTVVSHPFRMLGANAIIVYLSERFLEQVASNTEVHADGTTMTLEEWLFQHVLPGSSAGEELAYGVLLLTVILAIAYVMHALEWRIAL